VHRGGLAGALRDTAEVAQWLAGQTTDVLQRKALQAAHRLNPLEQKDLLATLRIAAHAERAKTAAAGIAPNRLEVHVKEMLDEIVWMVGDREPAPESLRDYMHTAAELRAEEEMRLMAGGKLANEEELKLVDFGVRDTPFPDANEGQESNRDPSKRKDTGG
jgi:hypothetical protein